MFVYTKKLGPDKTASQEIDITHEPIAERKEFYQVLTRNVGMRILLVSIIPIMLTSGILCRQFHLTYSESELKDGYGDVFTDIGIVDLDGIQFAYEGPFRLINADYSEVSWFLKAKENPYSISDVFAGIRGPPHFILAVKLSAQGHTHILKSTINFTAFNSLLGNVRIGRTGTAFIVNAKGELQTHPRSGTTGAAPSFIADPTIFKHDHTLILKHKNNKGNGCLYALALFKTVGWRMVFHQDAGDALKDIQLPLNIRHTAKPSTRDTANNCHGPSLVFTPRHGPQLNL